jgi:N-acetylglucosamine-6-sulfatase
MPRRRSAFRPPLGKPALLRRIDDLPPLGRATATTDDEIRGRLEMLLAVDESLGRIRRALEETGALDETVVVFTSDHGYFYGEHGLNEERRLAYEEAIRIPLIVRYPPRIPAGAVSPAMVLTIDVAPTLLALAGVAPSAGIQGRSVLPVVNGKIVDWRTSFLIEYATDTVFPRIRSMGYDAIRTERHKLIRYRELRGMDELYDLERDPYEERNLFGDTRAATTRARLEGELRQLLAATRDGR